MNHGTYKVDVAKEAGSVFSLEYVAANSAVQNVFYGNVSLQLLRSVETELHMCTAFLLANGGVGVACKTQVIPEILACPEEFATVRGRTLMGVKSHDALWWVEQVIIGPAVSSLKERGTACWTASGLKAPCNDASDTELVSALAEASLQLT